MPVRSSKNTIWGGLFLKDDSSEPLFSLVNVVSEKRKKAEKRDSDGVKDSQNRHLELPVV